MFTKKNIIIIISITIVVVIVLITLNNNKTNIQMRGDITTVNDNYKKKCLYMNSLSINSRYLIDYFKNNKDNWYVYNTIITDIVSDTELFSNNSDVTKNNLNYIILNNAQLTTSQTLNSIYALLPFSPNFSDVSDFEDNILSQNNESSLENIIIDKLSVHEKDTPVIYDTYKLIQNIKYQIYNIVKNGKNAKSYIYNKIFSNYIISKYEAFVIYVDYLHFNDINGINGIIDIIQSIYNIIKNINIDIPVNFIIELPRTLNNDDMGKKINMFVLDPLKRNELDTNVNPKNVNSPILRSLILGFNIVPGIVGDNYDISYYSNIWSNYINNNNFPYKFYFDAGNYGRDKIINNDSLIQSLPLNPSNITNIHNIVSYPHIIDIINNGKIQVDDDISINCNKITLNICPFTDSLVGYYDYNNVSSYYGRLVVNNLNNMRITVISTILPLFYKSYNENSVFYEYTLDDEYTSCVSNKIFNLNDLQSIIDNTYLYITDDTLNNYR